MSQFPHSPGAILPARLQEATACGAERPILLREESQAGHGQGKPVSKQAEETADVLAFLSWQLDMQDEEATVVATTNESRS